MTTARNAHVVYDALPDDGEPIPFVNLARKIGRIRDRDDGRNLERLGTLHKALVDLKRGGLADVCYGRGWYRTGRPRSPRPEYIIGGPPTSPLDWGRR